MTTRITMVPDEAEPDDQQQPASPNRGTVRGKPPTLMPVDMAEQIRRREALSHPAQRLTIWSQVAYHGGGRPLEVTTRHSIPVTQDQQPFQRWLTIGPEWVEIPRGWLEQCSLLVISNDTVPHGDIRTVTADGILVVGYLFPGATEPTAMFQVRPASGGGATGDSFRVNTLPGVLEALRLRCLTGQCRATATLFPK